MMATRWVAWMPLVVAAVLAAMTLWLGRLVDVGQTVDSRGFTHDPDYIVENFKATAFDPRGMPRHKLEAKKMIHYMDDDTTHLESPLYTQLSAKQPTVTVRAQRALVTPNGSDIHFMDDVRMVREAATERGRLVMTTSMLQVTPDAKRIKTNRPVTVRQAGSSIEAGAMLMRGDTSMIQFSHEVKSVYENNG